MADLPEHVARNRAYWDDRARAYVEEGRRNWESAEPHWGIFHVPEAEVGLLPAELEGRDAIELGCGTGYVSAWLARRGARPVGIDNSEAQLASARAFQREFGIEFPLLHGNAEEVPWPDGSFDLAISEYGASIWCDPYAWIPEAARLLRPGGELVFLVNSVLSILCGPQGKMIELLRDCGLTVEQLIEIRPPADATTRFPHISLEWARRYPCEEVWRARKRC